MHSDRNLLFVNPNSLFYNLFNLNISSSLQIYHHFGISWHLNKSVYRNIYNFLPIYIDRHFNPARFLYDMFDWRTCNWYLYNFLHNFLNDLRNFHDSFNNSRNYYNFLNNSLDFHTFRHLYNFFNNFFLGCRNFFYPLIVHLHRNCCFFFIVHWYFLFHDVWHIFGHLHRLLFIKDNILYDLNGNMLFVFHSLNERDLMDFSFNFHLWNYYRNLNIFLDLSDFNLFLDGYYWHFDFDDLNLFHNL